MPCHKVAMIGLLIDISISENDATTYLGGGLGRGRGDGERDPDEQ